MKYFYIIISFIFICISVSSQDKMTTNLKNDSIETTIFSTEEIANIFEMLKKDYVLYEIYNKNDTLGIIDKFLNEISNYVLINDSLKGIFKTDILNAVQHYPGKFTIDELGYLRYRNEMRLLKSNMIYKVIYKHLNSMDGITIMQEIKKRSKLIDSYIMNIKKISPYSEEDINKMPFLKTGWSRDLIHITAYKIYNNPN